MKRSKPPRDAITAKPSSQGGRGLPLPSIDSLYDQYEPEVIDFVAGLLDAGASSDEIVAQLKEHDFDNEEARVLVRAVAKGRPRDLALNGDALAAQFMMMMFERFPQMEPIKSVPSMVTVNGISASIYGHRDHDDETNSYVKTLTFTVAFIPLFAIAAYRVIDAEAGRGWHFIGREPLSPLAKGWGYCVGALFLMIFPAMVLSVR